MEFEYGCQTANKYMFLDENEVEDPSDLLAQLAVKKEEAPVAKGKAAGKGGKPADAKSKTAAAAPGAKDAKKQPLQQQTNENSVKPARGQQKGGAKPTSAGQGPREDKENTSNRQPGSATEPRRTGEYQNRRPRQEGEEGARPPRRAPRADNEGGQQQDRPPRRFRPQPAEGEVQQGEEGVAGEGRGAGGFRRGGGASGGRGNFNFRGNFRRAYNPENSRDFDRHSGSDKT